MINATEQVWFNVGRYRVLRDSKTDTYFPCFKLAGDWLPDTKRPVSQGRLPTEAEVAAAIEDSRKGV